MRFRCTVKWFITAVPIHLESNFANFLQPTRGACAESFHACIDNDRTVSGKEEIKEVTRAVARASAEAAWPQTRVILRVIIIVLAVAVTLWIVVKLTALILLLILSVFF